MEIENITGNHTNQNRKLLKIISRIFIIPLHHTSTIEA